MKPDVLTEHTHQEIEHWMKRFPYGRESSAVIAALHSAQHDNGRYLTAEIMDAVADVLAMPRIQVYEVATLYSMFQTKPVGRHCVAICTNISCMLRGADDLVNYVEDKLGIKQGESTADGRVYLKQEEECLATCCGAPLMMVDHRYFENLSEETVDKILEGLE